MYSGSPCFAFYRLFIFSIRPLKAGTSSHIQMKIFSVWFSMVCAQGLALWDAQIVLTCNGMYDIHPSMDKAPVNSLRFAWPFRQVKAPLGFDGKHSAEHIFVASRCPASLIAKSKGWHYSFARQTLSRKHYIFGVIGGGIISYLKMLNHQISTSSTNITEFSSNLSNLLTSLFYKGLTHPVACLLCRLVLHGHWPQIRQSSNGTSQELTFIQDIPGKGVSWCICLYLFIVAFFRPGLDICRCYRHQQQKPHQHHQKHHHHHQQQQRQQQQQQHHVWGLSTPWSLLAAVSVSCSCLVSTYMPPSVALSLCAFSMPCFSLGHPKFNKCLPRTTRATKCISNSFLEMASPIIVACRLVAWYWFYVHV